VTELQFVHPEYAHERACDLDQWVHSSQAQGEPPRNGFLVGGQAPVVSRAFYDSHYWGRPSRSVEVGLALHRAARDLTEDEARVFFRRQFEKDFS
jgi:hypothetical protein